MSLCFRAYLYAEFIKDTDKENSQPIISNLYEKAVRNEDQPGSIEPKTDMEEEGNDNYKQSGCDEKEKDPLPRRVLRSASAQICLAEFG